MKTMAKKYSPEELRFRAAVQELLNMIDELAERLEKVEDKVFPPANKTIWDASNWDQAREALDKLFEE